MKWKLLFFVASLAVMPAASADAASLPTRTVDNFSVITTAKATGSKKHRASLVLAIKIRAKGINRTVPAVRCDAKNCKRVRGGRFKAVSGSGSVTFTNVRWIVPRGKTFTVAVNRKGYLGRYQKLRRKAGSYTQFVVVKTGCTSKGFKHAKCPVVAPTRRCARRAAHQSGVSAFRDQSTTLTSGDFNGDGRDDVAAVYDYGTNGGGVFRFTQTAIERWEGAREWGAAPLEVPKLRTSSGDYNGDCFSDLAYVSDAGSNNTAVSVAAGSAPGLTQSPSQVWASSNSAYPWASSRPISGDFNGDEFDDLMLLTQAGAALSIVVFPGSANGLGSPQPAQTVPDWTLGLAAFVSGDFNGDGRDELSAFRSRGEGQGVDLWLFGGTGTWIGPPQVVWTSDSSWIYSTIQAVTGDTDGDNRSDISVAYATSAGGINRVRFGGNGSSFVGPLLISQAVSSNWDLASSKFSAGDFDGDGKSDVSAFYNYGPGSAGFWVYPGGGSAGVRTWFTATGWEWAHAR